MLNGQSRSSPHVSHPDGHPGDACQARLIVLLESHTRPTVILSSSPPAIKKWSDTKEETYAITVSVAFLIVGQSVHVIPSENITQALWRLSFPSFFWVVCRAHLHKLQMNCILFRYKGNLVFCEPLCQQKCTVPVQQISSHLNSCTNMHQH